MDRYGGNRNTLVLHEYDGIQRPLEPGSIENALRPITRKLRYGDGDYIIGFDGPGIVPAMALRTLTGLRTIFATKLDIERKPKLTFSEPDSRNPNVFLYGLHRGMCVIVVDDVTRTGRTLASCIDALHTLGVDIRGVVTLIEAKDHAPRRLIEERHCKLFSVSLEDI